MNIPGTLLTLLLLLVSAPYSAHAGDDPDRGMSRALGIEEAWVESALYLSSSRDNESTVGHTWNTGAQWDVALSKQWGIELDGPGLLAVDPIGKGAMALAPFTFGVKYAGLQWGDEDSVDAGVVSVEMEGSWFPHARPAAFPGIGSNMAEQVLIGVRHGSHWFQGEYGITQRLRTDARSGWFASSAIGQRLGDGWVVQMEVDVNHTSVRDNGTTALGLALTPQVGVRINRDWQLIVGETFARVAGQSSFTSTTGVMFEYQLDSDEEQEPGS
jgi:hypothetical protein